MAKKNQSKRLTDQHKKSLGVIGIFGENAKIHDLTVGEVSVLVMKQLQEENPHLTFRYRKIIRKEEINKILQKIDDELGQTLFVPNSNIKPDGGVIEVKDCNNKWRVVLAPEAKSQGKDIDNVKQGNQVGKKANQDLMVAGNAIERSHKNICELRNFMILESYFPYVIFLDGSNFLTETISIERPDGRIVTLSHDSGSLNRLDRLTAANYGLPINTNLCINKIIKRGDNTTLNLQTASIYTKGNGEKWSGGEMFSIMVEISKTSLRMLINDLNNN